MTLSFKNKILLLAFFIVLVTSVWANNIYLLFGFSVLCWILIPQKKWWDGLTVSLLLFSLFYGLMIIMNGKVNSNFNLFSYMITPVAFYRFGRWSMNIFKEEKSRQKFLMFSIFLYLLYFLILTFKDISLVGIVNPTRVLLGDLGDDHAKAATLYGLMASVGIGCIGVVFAKKENFGLRMGFIALALLALLGVIHLVNRTGVVIFVICIVFSFFISTKFNISKIFGALFILLVLGFLVVQLGLVDQSVLDAYAQREESATSDVSSMGGRSDMWLSAIGDMFVNPFGWNPIGYTFAHNMWLDIARVAGLLALIPFLVTTILHCKNLFKLLRSKYLSNFAVIILSINIAMLLSSFVEPVIDGSLLFFCLLMMIWGVTKTLALENKLK